MGDSQIFLVVGGYQSPSLGGRTRYRTLPPDSLQLVGDKQYEIPEAAPPLDALQADFIPPAILKDQVHPASAAPTSWLSSSPPAPNCFAKGQAISRAGSRSAPNCISVFSAILPYSSYGPHTQPGSGVGPFYLTEHVPCLFYVFSRAHSGKQASSWWVPLQSSDITDY